MSGGIGEERGRVVFVVYYLLFFLSFFFFGDVFVF